MTKLVAIHQPNFLPWLGWFDKLARADVFVVLDDVQFPKKGGTWTNRVRMLVQGRSAWVTLPVDRSYHGVKSVAAMKFDETKPWRDKIWRTIASSYARHPCSDSILPLLEPLILERDGLVASYNDRLIRAVATGLGLDLGKVVMSSTLAVEQSGTGRLIELVQAVGGDSYLAGGGAAGYQVDEEFKKAGIQLVEQRFEPRPYPQPTETFVPGLSVVDAVCSCGWEETRRLIG